MSHNTDSDRQYASFRQRHPYVDAFLDGLPADQMLLYLGLGFAFIWIGTLTVYVLHNEGATQAQLDTVMTGMQVASFGYIAGLPLLLGLGNAVTRWFEYNLGDR